MQERADSELRVLVADDDATVAMVVKAVLERRGHRVQVAGSAQAASRLVVEGTFDVALVDARMPGDGFELRRALEAGPLAGRTILMTGDPQARQAAANETRMLGKPFNYDVLVQMVEELGGAPR